jgi:hypothetical protein
MLAEIIMTRRLHIILVMVFITVHNGYGQKKLWQTFISYEVGKNINEFDFVNPQNNVELVNNFDIAPGFLLTQEIYAPLYFETGIYWKYFAADMYSTTSDTTNLIFAHNAYQIPIRLQLKNVFLKNRLHVSLSFGTSCIKQNSKPYSVSGIFFSDGSNKENIEGNDPKKRFFLFDFGIGLEFLPWKNITVGAAFRSNFGIHNYIDYHVTDDRPDGTTTDYYLKSKGNFYAVFLLPVID